MRANRPGAPSGEDAPAGTVLGVETSTSRGSVALCRGDEILGELLLTNPRSHSERLLPAVELLLGASFLGTGDLAAVAVSMGPGSFTGLRIGLAAAKGLAFSLGIPLYGIPSLEVLAANASPGTERVCAVIDARRGEVFSALYRVSRDALFEVEGAGVFDPETLARRLPAGALVIGEIAAALAAPLTARRGEKIRLAPSHQCIPRAAVVALRGEALLRSGSPSEAETLLPLYLRPSDAEANRKAGEARRRAEGWEREKTC